MALLDLLGLKKKESGTVGSPEAKTVREIVGALQQLEPQRAKFVACFAYVLGRVANADLQISAEETRAMERIVREIGGLPEAQAVIVVQMAKTHTQLFGGTDNYLVTREFNQLATREQKLALLQCLFAVSAADESISAVEDNEIKQIATELHLSRDDWIGTRAAYRDYLAVLKRL